MQPKSIVQRGSRLAIAVAAATALTATLYYRYSHAQPMQFVPALVTGQAGAPAPLGLPDMASIAAQFGDGGLVSNTPLQ